MTNLDVNKHKAISIIKRFIYIDISFQILLTVSCTALSISFGILAVFMQTDLTVRSLNWLPLTVLATAVISYGLGLYAVPFIVINEIANLEVSETTN